MKTRLKDIAEHAGLDVSTVSRALRNDTRVNPKTRFKVLQLAEQLDYVPDWSARALSGGKSGIIGIIFPEVKHSFYAEIFEEISTITVQRSMTPELILTEFDPSRIDGINKQVLAQHLDGVIIAYHNLNFSFFRENQLPVVLIDVIDTDNVNVDKVVVDNFSGAKEAVDYLILLGHQKIGFISDTVTTPVRLGGYKDSFKKQHIEMIDNFIIIRQGRSEEVGYQAGMKLLVGKDRPSAVFCVNDLIAIGLMKAAFEIGLKIPEELSIIGFDDLPISSYLPFPLTTVRQPIRDIAGESLQVLLHRMENRHRKRETKVLSTELVIRNTTARYRKP
jgi:LacI family transcriptional regulator